MKKRRRRRVKRVPFPLKDLLAAKGWSQRQLAFSTEIDYATINAIANGRTIPTWSVIRLILTTVGADFGDLAPKGGAA